MGYQSFEMKVSRLYEQPTTRAPKNTDCHAKFFTHLAHQRLEIITSNLVSRGQQLPGHCTRLIDLLDGIEISQQDTASCCQGSCPEMAKKGNSSCIQGERIYSTAFVVWNSVALAKKAKALTWPLTWMAISSYQVETPCPTLELSLIYQGHCVLHLHSHSSINCFVHHH